MKIVYCMKINQMKHIFTLLTLALMSSLSAQTVLPPNYPFNPDSDGDEFVAVSDVLMSVASYDNEFQAQSIMIDTLSLEEAIQMLLQQQSLNQQALIDGLTNSLAGVEGFDPCPLHLQWSCGCPLTYQGYDYATVLIGEQCWFAENLRSENYENGDAINSGLAPIAWYFTTAGAVAVYGEASPFGEDASCNNFSPDIDACDPALYLNEYGRLYNWYAVIDARGLCPSGWRVPSDVDWMVLEMTLGMSESEANAVGSRGTDQGAQMKTNYGWNGGDNGTNSSGFSGLPGGFRAADGLSFEQAGNYGIWWSSSPSDSYAWVRFLYANGELVDRSYDDQRNGFSVRCVRDAE